MTDFPQLDTVCRQIVENAGEAIVVADREGLIRLWNHGAQKIFGHPPEEALGRSLDLIIPETLRFRHWDGYHKVMATGETRYGDSLLAVPALHRDGRRLSIEFTVIPLHDVAGRMTGIASVIRDVTERWQKEQSLRKRLAELESRSGQPPREVLQP
jgi:PAS domain S-box-containing protein